jgi:gliding motility-associated-like protein
VTVSNTQCTASQTVEVTVSPTPEATIEYGGPYCSNAANVPVTFTGTTGGTFSGTTGLVIDPVTGEVNLAASTAATHTVTYSIAATPSCGPLVITDEIIITPAPEAEFTYDSLVFCQSATSTETPTFNGDAVAGIFTVNQAGLTIDPATGVINPATSTVGDYIVTNTIAAANGCAEVTDTQAVSIIAAPIATFNYGVTEFCPEGTVSPNITGATGGSFSAPDGLSINNATGIIDLSASDAGTYIIRYTIAATAECAEEFEEITITVKPRPVFNLGGPYVVCDASFATISVNAENFNTANATYIWTLDGEVLPDTGSSFVATGFGSYEVIVTLNGCSDTASVQVTQETATVDFTLFEGCVDNVYRLEVIPGVNNDNTSFDPETTAFMWTVPAEFTGTVPTTAFIEPNAPGLYTVTFTTAGGCTATDGFTVTTTSCQIQKGISPGDAGDNNFFDLTALNVVHLSIFNRYGQEVFSYGNYTNEWGGQDNSGNELPTGTYFYSLERSNGETRTGWVYINRQN